MEHGELITRWIIRVAMVFYVVGLATRGSWPRWSRWAWTIGCGLYLAHVAAAFEYFHHWSEAQAYAFTEQRSEEVVGLRFGGGLYVNYLFTLVWLGDVAWRWTNRPRPRWLGWVIDIFMGFIAFNATVVFAEGFSRYFGIAAGVLLAGLASVRYGLRGKRAVR